jgi:hypothetical protein
LALTSPTSGGRSVGIVCLLIKATEFVKETLYKIVDWCHLAQDRTRRQALVNDEKVFDGFIKGEELLDWLGNY